MRKRFGLLLAVLCAVITLSAQEAAGNDSQNSSEMSVEDAYLESYTNMVVSEYVNADGRDNKMVAIQYIKKAVEGGNSSPEIVNALTSLATDGIKSVSRENGRVVNNYPDIRRDACELLGQVKTEESKNALVQVLYTDNEPMVITAAVRSLGEIGINNADETTEMIAWIAKKFDVVNPTSSLALEILDAFEKLAPTVQNPASMLQMIIQISTNHQYVTPVRQRARKVLESIGTQSRQQKQSSGKAEKK